MLSGTAAGAAAKRAGAADAGVAAKCAAAADAGAAAKFAAGAGTAVGEVVLQQAQWGGSGNASGGRTSPPGTL